MSASAFAPKLATIPRECSVLRNETLQSALTSSVIDWEPIFDFMSDLSGKPVTLVEKRLDVSSDCCKAMARVISHRAYMKWPALVSKQTQEKSTNKPTDDDQELREYMTKWFRKYNKGKAFRDALRHAIKRFEARCAREAGLA
ncbi:hypothetical protein C0995_014213 [Termitomyces sp. Mi166|nr:hypothetical protein C0995_014213 [Termitomyces sp. Mi166\